MVPPRHQTHFSAIKTLGQTSSTSFQGASWRCWAKARCRSRMQGVLYRLVSSIFSLTRLYRSSTSSCSADSSMPGHFVSALTPRGLSSRRTRKHSHQRGGTPGPSLLLGRTRSWPICCQDSAYGLNSFQIQQDLICQEGLNGDPGGACIGLDTCGQGQQRRCTGVGEGTSVSLISSHISLKLADNFLDRGP